MTRITKDPVERKKELVAVAEKLFLENGYDRTNVSDIVKTVGIAQGTFYYHFKSKEDILEAVANRIITGIENEIRKYINPSQEQGYIGKGINDMINALFQIKRANTEFLNYIHQDSNVILHNKLSKKTMDRLTRLLKKIIDDGVDRDELEVDYPGETAELLASTIYYVWHLNDMNAQRHDRIRHAVGQTLARTLGIEKYLFNLDLR